MNRSKILGASALASLMAAGAAQAEMSVSGYVLGAFADSDGGGLSNYNTSETVTVSYSDSLDNGMGLAVGMDIGDTLGTVVTIDTGMGSVTFSADAKGDSALDKVDGSTACFGLFWCASAYNASYNDGDEVSGNSIRYVSPSINGFTIQASHGLEGDYDNSGHTGAGGTAVLQHYGVYSLARSSATQSRPGCRVNRSRYESEKPRFLFPHVGGDRCDASLDREPAVSVLFRLHAVQSVQRFSHRCSRRRRAGADARRKRGRGIHRG